MSNLFEGMEIISQYTREQALEDGVLYDLSKWGKEMGIKYPIACTSTLYGYINPPSNLEGVEGQSLDWRAYDTVFMLAMAIQGQGNKGKDTLFFSVAYLNNNEEYDEVKIKAICGPGDQGEPVITLMLPDES